MAHTHAHAHTHTHTHRIEMSCQESPCQMWLNTGWLDAIKGR